MKFHKQRFRHEPHRGIYGDCHRAALASLFELSLDDVPHFSDGGPTAAEFNDRVSAWLRVRNLTSVNIGVRGSLTEVLGGIDVVSPDAFWMLSGLDISGAQHTVICRRGRIIHDPARDMSTPLRPNANGEYTVTFLVIREPERCVSADALPAAHRLTVMDRFRAWSECAVELIGDSL